MRSVVLGLAVSLDGFIEGPNGEFDWCFTDQDYGMSEFFKNTDAMFIGRRSYEVLLAQGDAAPFPKLHRYIFSNTLARAAQNDVIVGGDIASHVRTIRARRGKNIWLFGGASLTTSLMNLGLVNELWLSIHPIVLGGGKPLFSGLDRRVPLQHLETKAYSTGLVSVRYSIKQ